MNEGRSSSSSRRTARGPRRDRRAPTATRTTRASVRAGEHGRLRVAGVEHRQPVVWQCLEQSSLLPRDAGATSEQPGVREPDVGDHADRRTCDRAQRRDVARFGARPSRAPALRCRVGAPRSVIGRPISALKFPGVAWTRIRGTQRGRGEVLRARLTGGTGDADDEWRRAAARGPSGRWPRAPRARRSPASPRRVLAAGAATTGFVTSATVAPRRERVLDEIVAVARGLERDEARSGLERSRVVGERRRARVARAGDQRPTGRGGDLGGGQLHPSPPSSSERDRPGRRTGSCGSRSSGRSRAPCRRSRPRPRGRRCGAHGGSRRGGRARPRHRRCRRGARGAPHRRSPAGSSDRGLSDVSTARSEPLPAAAPMSGRFDGSRSPPQPKTTMTFPCHCGPRPAPPASTRAAARTASSSPGACA